jgi:hypothetical protein
MLIVMSISHPRLRSFSLEASLKNPAALAAKVGMVHYISTQESLIGLEVHSKRSTKHLTKCLLNLCVGTTGQERTMCRD